MIMHKMWCGNASQLVQCCTNEQHVELQHSINETVIFVLSSQNFYKNKQTITLNYDICIIYDIRLLNSTLNKQQDETLTANSKNLIMQSYLL